MSELFRYPDGTTERRYTHMEARLVLAIRAVVMVISLPFLLVVYSTTLFGDTEDTMRRFQPKSIRLVDGEFYP